MAEDKEEVGEKDDEEETVFTLSKDNPRKGSNAIEAYIEECLSKVNSK